MINMRKQNVEWLDNSYTSPMIYNGKEYPSLENAYQAAKCRYDTDHHMFQITKPIDARRIGKQIQRREDWSHVKTDILLELILIKFQNPDLQEKLKSIDQNTVILYFLDERKIISKHKRLDLTMKAILKIQDELKTTE